MIKEKGKSKRYDPAFIERARALGEEIGIARAARVLGLPGDAIRSWIRAKNQGKHMSSNDTPEQRELIEVKRELHKIKKENEDLKKANIILRELSSVFSRDRFNSNLGWSLKSTRNGRKS